MTINGAHVLISGAGQIEAGPPGMVGQAVGDHPRDGAGRIGRKPHKERPKPEAERPGEDFGRWSPAPSPTMARVGTPTSDRPGEERIPRLPNLGPKERSAESAFARLYLSHPDELARHYRGLLAAKKVGDAPNVFSTDDAKALSEDWQCKGCSPEEAASRKGKLNLAVHQTANAIAKRAFLQHLDEVVAKLPEDQRTVLVTQGGVASGKGYAISKVVPELAGRAGAVWDAAGEQNSTEAEWVLRESEKRGIRATFVYVNADPMETWENPSRGVVERAGKKGRMVDARLFAESYALGARNFQAFMDAHRGEADFKVIDNRGETKLLDRLPPEALEVDADAVRERALRVIKERRHELQPHVVAGATAGERVWEGKAPEPDQMPQAADDGEAAGLVAKHAKTLSSAQSAQLRAWTQPSDVDSPLNYKKINELARKCPKTLDCVGEAAKRFLTDGLKSMETVLPEPVRAWRGIDVDGKTRDALVAQAEGAMRSGQTLRFGGGMSTSLKPEIAFGVFGAGRGAGETPLAFEVVARSGVWAEPHTAAPGQSEFLQPHGTRFRVVEIKSGHKVPREYGEGAGRGEREVTLIRLEKLEDGPREPTGSAKSSHAPATKAMPVPWDEDKHPRDRLGRFGHGGHGGTPHHLHGSSGAYAAHHDGGGARAKRPEAGKIGGFVDQTKFGNAGVYIQTANYDDGGTVHRWVSRHGEGEWSFDRDEVLAEAKRRDPKATEKPKKLPASARKQSLKRSPVKDARPIVGGHLNAASIITLEDGTKAVFKPGSGEDIWQESVPKGEGYIREAAASAVADIVGLGDLVPPTVVREVDGEVGSAQEFKRGVPARNTDDPFDGELTWRRAAALDYLIVNMDRHDGNWLVREGGTEPDLVLIDNGTSFPDKYVRHDWHNVEFLAWAAYKDADIPASVKAGLRGKWPEIQSTMEGLGLSAEAVKLTKGRYRELMKYKKFRELSLVRDFVGVNKNPQAAAVADMNAASDDWRNHGEEEEDRS